MSELIEQLMQPVNFVKCGGCKATGMLHQWNKVGDLVPAYPPLPCPSCCGTGMALAAHIKPVRDDR